MKVSTTLENIEYTLQQRNKQQEQEKTKQEIKKDYLDTLTDEIEFILYDFFENSGDFEITYNYLFLNNTDFINKIITTMREESERHTTTRTKIITTGDSWREIEETIYLWDDFYIEKDTNKLYNKILKEIYKEYKEKNNIIENKLIQELDKNFISIFEKKNYFAALDFFKDNTIKDLIVEDITKNTYKKEFLNNNYYKELNRIKNIYKIKKEDKKQLIYTPNKATQTKHLKRATPLILTGSAVGGLINGLIKASKS